MCWDGDSGRDNFYREEGYAVIPETKKEKDELVKFMLYVTTLGYPEEWALDHSGRIQQLLPSQ